MYVSFLPTKLITWPSTVMNIKTTKIDHKKIGISLNPKHETKIRIKKLKSRHEMCEIKIKINFYCNAPKKNTRI